MSEEEILKDFLHTLKISFKNASMYGIEHPVFSESTNKLKEKIDNLYLPRRRGARNIPADVATLRELRTHPRLRRGSRQRIMEHKDRARRKEESSLRPILQWIQLRFCLVNR